MTFETLTEENLDGKPEKVTYAVETDKATHRCGHEVIVTTRVDVQLLELMGPPMDERMFDERAATRRAVSKRPCDACLEKT